MPSPEPTAPLPPAMSGKPDAHTYHYYPQANINFQELMSNVGLGFGIEILYGITGLRFMEGYQKGHEGLHIEIVWFQYEDPEQFEIRLLNSWENEPQYIYPNGETRGTIIPKVFFSFNQKFD